MKIVDYSAGLTPDQASVVTVGTFDGVHLGHQAVLNYLIAKARDTDGISTVITFDPHPRDVIHADKIPLLTTIEERAKRCKAFGIDRFVVIPFTVSFSKISAREFVRDVLKRDIGMQEIIIGHDHSFGRGQEGDEQMLRSLGKEHHFSVDTIPSRIVAESAVSSSRIRNLLLVDGKVGDANRLLGYEYELLGRVVHGSSRGREIGFPTANLMPQHSSKVIPANGVYAVRVCLDSEKVSRAGMMNIGVRPTFGESVRTIEVHILDYEEDLYDTQLRVEFVERIREERRFEGIESLVRQLNQDKERCIASLAERPVVQCEEKNKICGKKPH